MNFYGHAQFAWRLAEHPAYALGSMLPDFEGMCGTRLVAVLDADVERGIALHHATDEAFHHSAPFLALCGEGLDALLARGVPRAPARACAHVGTELVFDAYLIGRHGACAGYLAALDEAETARRGADLRFTDDGTRFERLRRRLHEFGVPHAYREAPFVAARLHDALARRPRLALDVAHVPLVVDWLEHARPRIHARGPELEAIVSAAIASKSLG